LLRRVGEYSPRTSAIPRKEAGLLYLALAVLCSTSIALIFKFSESRGMNRYVVTTANYMVASSVSLALLLQGGVLGSAGPGTVGAFIDELPRAVSGAGFGPQGSLGWAAMVGIPAGVLYFLGFIYLQKGVRESGVSLAGSFSKLGVLVPMALSILIWHEVPTGVQWVGIALALGSILLANLDVAHPRRAFSAFSPVLIMLFLIVGLAEFSNKVYQRYGSLEAKSLFLLFVFGVALLVSLIRSLRSRRIRLAHFLTGLAVGVPNYFASHFLILSLSRLRTAVVFPIYSAMTIVLISLAGWLVFGERLRPRERLAVALTVVALVLVNLQR
jgi:drug/metabolite transporter (DMT)-like permease